MTKKFFQNELIIFEKLISKARKILLISHLSPDGDTIGSALALDYYLAKLKKEVDIFCADPISERYDFLDHKQFKNQFKPEYDLYVCLDCGSLDMSKIESKLASKLKPSINIDHHPTNQHFADLNIVKPETSSTCEILYLIFQEMGVKFDRKLATFLMIGLVTDTGGFLHSNTTRRTLLIGSNLLKFGVNLKQITSHLLQEKRISALKLWGLACERLYTNPKWNIAISYTLYDDLQKYKISKDELGGLVNLIGTIPEAKISLLLREEEKGMIKGSLRTEDPDIDLTKLAVYLLGGGHKKAAGFSIPGNLIEENGKLKII